MGVSIEATLRVQAQASEQTNSLRAKVRRCSTSLTWRRREIDESRTLRPRHNIELGVSLSLLYRLEERETFQSLKEGGLDL